MGKFQKGNTVGKQFKPGQIANPDGRPRKLLSQLKHEGYTATQVKDSLDKVLACHWEMLDQILEDPHSTVLEIWLANIIKKANSSGNHGPLMDLLTRLYGQPKQTVDVQALVITKQIITLPDGSTLEI